MTAKKTKLYKMVATVVLYPGMAGWHFLYLPSKVGKEIKSNFGQNSHGFGSLPVKVTLGKTVWDTSIFPDKTSGSYLLPLKKLIRKKEGVQNGEQVKFTIKLKI